MPQVRAARFERSRQRWCSICFENEVSSRKGVMIDRYNKNCLLQKQIDG